MKRKSPEIKQSSTAALAPAPAEKSIRRQERRYQRGSLSLRNRERQPDVWVFRFYSNDGDRTVYKRKIVGTIIEFPKRKDAEKATAQLRVAVNEGAAFAPMNMEQLITHYRCVELPSKAHSTIEGYKSYFDLHILPRWGEHSLSAVKSVAVEAWLRDLKRVDGKVAAPGTKTKLRNMLSALFSHAIRHEWAALNPITAVRTTAKRVRIPDILTSEEFQALLPTLGQRERLIVLLDATTGLRRGELIGLYWKDIDFTLKQANVTHSTWRNVEGATKTEASRRPVPLHDLVIDGLRQWRAVTVYGSDDDFIFPSIRKNGKQPISPDSILKSHLRPALWEIGVTKRIRFHSFRHGFATMLRKAGVDLKTAQELLRHANSRITLETYQQTVGSERRDAQNLALGSLMGGG